MHANTELYIDQFENNFSFFFLPKLISPKVIRHCPAPCRIFKTNSFTEYKCDTACILFDKLNLKNTRMCQLDFAFCTIQRAIILLARIVFNLKLLHSTLNITVLLKTLFISCKIVAARFRICQCSIENVLLLFLIMKTNTVKT